MFAQSAGNLLDGGQVFTDHVFSLFGDSLLFHLHFGHVLDNAADNLFLVDVEDHHVKQPVAEADMFAPDVLFKVERSRKQVGEVYEVAKVGAAKVVSFVNFPVFRFRPESFGELVVIFDDV